MRSKTVGINIDHSHIAMESPEHQPAPKLPNMETTALFLAIASDPVLSREAIETVAKVTDDGRDSSESLKKWTEQLLELEDMGRPNHMRIKVGSLWRINWQQVARALIDER